MRDEGNFASDQSKRSRSEGRKKGGKRKKKKKKKKKKKSVRGGARHASFSRCRLEFVVCLYLWGGGLSLFPGRDGVLNMPGGARTHARCGAAAEDRDLVGLVVVVLETLSWAVLPSRSGGGMYVFIYLFCLFVPTTSRWRRWSRRGRGRRRRGRRRARGGRARWSRGGPRVSRRGRCRRRRTRCPRGRRRR